MSKYFNSVDFIKQVLAEYNPQIDTRPSTAFHDLFLRPQSYVLQPILEDSTHIAESQSVKNIASMSEDEADLLIANLTISRRTGGKATGYVRFYFNSLSDVQISQGTVVISSSGLRYLTTDDIIVSKESLSLNTDGGYYYVTGRVEAEDYGTEYNILPNEIVSLEGGVSSVTKVNNLTSITCGAARETNEDLYNRALDAIATKNLLAKRSINTVLFESFASLQDILTIGYGDAEMYRDTIETTIDGTTFEIHIGGKADIYCNTGVLGLTDATADSTAMAIIPASYYRKISSTGTSYSTAIFIDGNGDFLNTGIVPGYILRILTGAGVGDYTIASVDSATQLTTTSAITFTDQNIGYQIVNPSTPWSAPIIEISQVDRLDPGSLTETGIMLYDGRTVLVDPKLITTGGDPELTVDDEDDIHCVFEKDDDIWYTKITNAGLVEITATNLSNATLARNPSITFDTSSNIVIMWESDDATSDKFDLMMTVLDKDGAEVVSPFIAIDATSSSFTMPSITANVNGINVVSIKDSTVMNYNLIDVSDYNTVLTNEEIIDQLTDLTSPHCTSDGNYTYSAVSDGSLIYISKISSAGTDLIPGVVASSGTTNTEPSIGVDSTGNIYSCWNSDETSVYIIKLDELGSAIYNETLVLTMTEHARSPRVAIDSSDKIHIVVVDENENSGDVNYMKFDGDLSSLVERDIVQDQYNNATTVSIILDSNRRPHIIWDSYDTRSSKIYYTKRQSQDYKILVLNENYRYSIREIVNIKVDPTYAADYLRFTYKYESNIADIDEFVVGESSLDRVVNADYLVRYPTPVFIDIDIEYSGSDSSALTIITNYINDSLENSLSASELVAALPSSVAARVTLPFEIRAERHNQDGTITISRSKNLITQPRTSKFIARDIVVS